MIPSVVYNPSLATDELPRPRTKSLTRENLNVPEAPESFIRRRSEPNTAIPSFASTTDQHGLNGAERERLQGVSILKTAFEAKMAYEAQLNSNTDPSVAVPVDLHPGDRRRSSNGSPSSRLAARAATAEAKIVTLQAELDNLYAILAKKEGRDRNHQVYLHFKFVFVGQVHWVVCGLDVDLSSSGSRRKTLEMASTDL